MQSLKCIYNQGPLFRIISHFDSHTITNCVALVSRCGYILTEIT